MKKFKKIILSALVIMAVGVTGVTAFAKSQYKSPAEVTAGVTGKTIESVTAERREENKTYGTIAKENGKLDEFKRESLEMKKDILETRVAEEKITKEKADSIIKSIEERQVDCDGEGSLRLGEKENLGFGFNGNQEQRENRQSENFENRENLGQGRRGHHENMGNRNVNGSGLRLRDNSCADPIK